MSVRGLEAIVCLGIWRLGSRVEVRGFEAIVSGAVVVGSAVK